MTRSLAQIAVEANLVSRADLTRALELADEQRLPLVVVLVRELGVDEVALVGALRRELRVLAIDPRAIRPDTDALREVPRDVCKRLRVVPLQVRGGEPGGDDKEIWLAMADPTDHGAIAEVERMTGAVVDVAATIDSAARGVAIRVQAPTTRRPLKIGETVFGVVAVGTRPNAIVIPNDALVPDGEKFKVFVVDPNGIAHEREVKVGGRSANGVVIDEGLTAGERVVTQGAYAVSDSARVQPLAAPPGKP